MEAETIPEVKETKEPTNNKSEMFFEVVEDPTIDDSINIFRNAVDQFTRMKAVELNLKRATISGVLHLIAHTIEHESM